MRCSLLEYATYYYISKLWTWFDDWCRCCLLSVWLCIGVRRDIGFFCFVGPVYLRPWMTVVVSVFWKEWLVDEKDKRKRKTAGYYKAVLPPHQHRRPTTFSLASDTVLVLTMNASIVNSQHTQHSLPHISRGIYSLREWCCVYRRRLHASFIQPWYLY